MADHILVCTAWPYANGPLHLGHIAGCYLPADIFARYQRMIGNKVLMVSGSDQHGTPITLHAEQRGITPKEVVDEYHKSFLDCWERLGISFDCFTSTGTENHRQTVHEIFEKLYETDRIYETPVLLPYCAACERFLPDRYVEGKCPHCLSSGARGDQCDNCGKTLEPSELIDLRCKLSGDSPTLQESAHLFFRLSDFRDQLALWVSGNTHWRTNTSNFTKRFLEDGLKDRAITRDIDWGISIPVTGYEDKRIYVWFEAVIGYLSASREWANTINDPNAWQEFWNEDSKSYYFIGKDNIPFHTIIWPAMLLGYGNLPLPYDVPANEFLNLEGRQLSTSRNWAVWVPDYLDNHEPDPLRYCLSAGMPETSDADFSWNEYVRRNNDELVATYGNLIHRTLTLVQKHFAGKVPQPSSLDTPDQELITATSETMVAVGDYLQNCHFRQGMQAIMRLAQQGNRYINNKEPWATIKTNQQLTATTLWVALNTISALKVMMTPYLPFSSEQLHTMLGQEGTAAEMTWAMPELVPNHQMNQPERLFKKFDTSIIEQEQARMEQP